MLPACLIMLVELNNLYTSCAEVPLHNHCIRDSEIRKKNYKLIRPTKVKIK